VEIWKAKVLCGSDVGFLTGTACRFGFSGLTANLKNSLPECFLVLFDDLFVDLNMNWRKLNSIEIEI
jgi:hypothetical protein